MSQPEMRPEGGSRRSGAERGDLLGRAFPLGDWGEPAERLDELYVRVEQRALCLADRYLAARVWKRRGSRTLRAGIAAGALTGTALPLLALTGTLGGRYGAWGYLALLGAAVCLGGDRYFGLTSGWMRDIATAQEVQRRLESLQYDWASEAIREVLGPTEGSVGEAADRSLEVLRRFTEDVTEIVRAETTDWMLEFRADGSTPARFQATVPRPARAAAAQPTTNGHHLPLPPGFRPSMPRQRPPE